MTAKWDFLELHDEKDQAEFAAESLAVSVQLAILKAMAKSCVSQKQLAERLGVSTARVSQILSAHGRNLTLATLGKIAHALQEDFEFISVRDLQEIKAQSRPSVRRKPAEIVRLEEVWEIAESPWTDETANENKFPWKVAA